MKRKLFALSALVLGLVSCQNDFTETGKIAGGEVDFTLSVGATELTRAGEDGKADDQNAKDSAFGAIDYFQGADWSQVDLRYSLEVYDADADFTSGEAVPVKDRMVKVVDEYEPVSFDLRLISGREYRFVVFADFVPQGATDKVTDDQDDLGLHHIIGDTLQDIVVKEDTINDETTDAYFAKATFEISNSSPKNITLQRPYGKIRVIATDLAELNLNSNPTKVVVTYDAEHPTTFNAVTGAIETELAQSALVFESTYNDGVGKESLANHFYTEGYDAKTVKNDKGVVRHSHMTLFTDYILASDEQSPVHFNMDVYDGEELIKHTEFDTEIPVQRNHLTTIIGNVLTTATSIDVDIDDNFTNKDEQYYVFEALVNGGELPLEEDYVIGRPIYVEADAVLNLNGHTIKNAEGNKDTDVIIVREGATLTINGEGTIEAVSGNDGYTVIAEGTVIINGGEFKSGVDAAGAPNAVVYARGNGKVFVNGGVFHNEHTSKYVLNKKDADRATTTIEVRGGLFQNFNPANNAAENAGTNFLAKGYGVIEKENNWFEVVTMIDVKNGEEFKAAAKESKYVYINIVADIDCGTEYVVVSTDKIILGNGYKFIAGGKTTKNYALGFQDGVKAVVNDLVLNGGGGIYVSGGSNVEVNNVTLKANYSTSSRHLFYVNNATLTVNSGIFEVLRTSSHYFTLQDNAKVFVKGGTFADMVSAYAPVKADAGTTIEISGGKFQVNVPNYKFDPTPYLAAGYTTQRVGDYLEVIAE